MAAQHLWAALHRGTRQNKQNSTATKHLTSLAPRTHRAAKDTKNQVWILTTSAPPIQLNIEANKHLFEYAGSAAWPSDCPTAPARLAQQKGNFGPRNGGQKSRHPSRPLSLASTVAPVWNRSNRCGHLGHWPIIIVSSRVAEKVSVESGRSVYLKASEPALWCSGIADGLQAWRWQLAAVRHPPGPRRKSWRGTQTKAQHNAATRGHAPNGACTKKVYLKASGFAGAIFQFSLREIGAKLPI